MQFSISLLKELNGSFISDEYKKKNETKVPSRVWHENVFIPEFGSHLHVFFVVFFLSFSVSGLIYLFVSQFQFIDQNVC